MRTFFEFDRAPHDVGGIAEGDHATDQRAIAVIKTLAINAQNRVGLIDESINGKLVGELLTATCFHQRQLIVFHCALAIRSNTAKCSGPISISFLSWRQIQNRARGWIYIEDVPMAVDHNYTVIDTF